MTQLRLLVVVGLLLGAIVLSVHGIPARAAVDPAPPQPAWEPAAASYATAGNAITYQGYLTDGGTPADGPYDFSFSLYADAAGTQWVTTAAPVSDLQVNNGYFTARVDLTDAAYGDVHFYLNGEPRWLRVSVRPGASTLPYVPLWPLQALTPAPYAQALPGLHTVQNDISPNVVGGYAWNSVNVNAVGATVAGGGSEAMPNAVNAHFGTVGGGLGNTAGGQYSTVAGGAYNNAGGEYSTVAGGMSNSAAGNYAFAAGSQAKANYDGSFVWADNSTGSAFASTRENRFEVRAANGTGFYANNTGYGMLVENGLTAGNGDGIRVFANRSSTNSVAALYARNDGNSPGVYADSNGGYAAYFADDIYVAGSCVGCTLVYVAMNDGNVALEEGDLVAATGLAPSLMGSNAPVLRVQRAAAGGDEAIAGVVRARGELLVSPPKEDEARASSAVESVMQTEGAAAPGDYLFIVVQGIARVRVDASAGTIAAGQRLAAAAGPGGGARALRTVVVDGVTLAEGASTLGIALEAAGGDGAGNALIAVLVDLQ